MQEVVLIVFISQYQDMELTSRMEFVSPPAPTEKEYFDDVEVYMWTQI